ncbi:hypothetical protein VD0002_g2671 [Verticillium dahliae]|nr:Putative U3 small nucleolar RNA-associated protein 11 [Verticillium dahliae VDG2]PNH56594.1 hypothetical protein VD0003_g1131 [Verticillium dahliae]PNH66822.1 hypothetical protein VD0002_g2671 [Verticillium dahliae]
MAPHIVHFCLSAVLTAYMVWTAVEVYFSQTKTNRPSTPAHYAASPVLAILLAPIAMTQYSKAKYLSKMRSQGCLPAPVYPHSDPILGLDWLRVSLKAMKNHVLLEHWQSAFKRVGNTFWVNAVGKWVLMTNDPENLKAILASSFDDWVIDGPRLNAVLPMLGPHAIFSANGALWQDARATMRPSFVRNQIADLACFQKHVNRLLDKIPKDGQRVELQELLYRMTMDSATEFMFGHSTNTLTNPTAEAVEFFKMFDYVNARSANRARLGVMGFLDRDKKFDEGIRFVHRFVDEYVEKVQAEKRSPERSYVFLNEMVDSGRDPQYIRSQLLALILAGRDTTASILSSLLWILARRPDIVQALRTEIDGLGDAEVTWEALKQMKYLNMVMKEALRLFPPVSSLSRSAARDTVLPVGGGPDGKSPIFVPKGNAVRWSVFALQRREDIFGPDADEFRPERWNELRVSWEYIPFSGGPRVCIGQQFALTQMGYFLVRLFQTFDSIEARDDLPMQQEMMISLKLANDLWVGLKRA